MDANGAKKGSNCRLQWNKKKKKKMKTAITGKKILTSDSRKNVKHEITISPNWIRFPDIVQIIQLFLKSVNENVTTA